MNLYKEKHGNIIVYHHEYYDLRDFLMTILNGKINYSIFQDPGSISGSYEFTNTSSFEEAWDMCRFTWNEGFEDFSNDVKKINLRLDNEHRIIHKYKVVGSSPSVPRYLLGIPTSMHAKEKIYDKKVISIYFNISYNCQTTIEQIRNRGILTLSLINHLENSGLYQINFHFVYLGYHDGEIIYLNIPLKKNNENLNVKKCYFPIVHPSFLRRLCFRSMEITPVRSNWGEEGYGIPMKFDDVRGLFNNDFNNSIYISSPQEMGINGEDINDDVESFIRIINTNYKDILDRHSEEREDYGKQKSR